MGYGGNVIVVITKSPSFLTYVTVHEGCKLYGLHAQVFCAEHPRVNFMRIFFVCFFLPLYLNLNKGGIDEYTNTVRIGESFERVYSDFQSCWDLL